MGLAEIGGVLITQAMQHVEVASQNLANMATPGYKARSQFLSLVTDDLADPVESQRNHQDQFSVDFTVGKLRQTGNPLDLAISGSGFFVVRSGDTTSYTRSGQFSRDGDGHLVTPDGGILQSETGDLTLGDGDFNVLADGTVTQAGQPAAQLTIANFDNLQALKPLGANLFSASTDASRDAANPQIHQGMLEASNVSMASEMLAVMKATRSAETGQRVVQIYDDLMGQAITAFGQT